MSSFIIKTVHQFVLIFSKIKTLHHVYLKKRDLFQHTRVPKKTIKVIGNQHFKIYISRAMVVNLI